MLYRKLILSFKHYSKAIIYPFDNAVVQEFAFSKRIYKFPALTLTIRTINGETVNVDQYLIGRQFYWVKCYRHVLSS